MDILKKSIEYYQKSKKEIIDQIINEQIDNEQRDLEEKENELMFWKHQYEQKIIMNRQL